MTDSSKKLTDKDLEDVVSALQEKFHKQQTTPIQDKKLVVPVALASVIVLALVTATWNVSSFYETAINARLVEGARQRVELRKDIISLSKDMKKAQEDLMALTKAINDNSRDIDRIWPDNNSNRRPRKN